MLTLHVTRDLANALKLPAKIAAPPNAAGSALGPWSLGLVHSRPAKLVVAVSTTTRWAFALHAAPLATLQQRFGSALLLNLLAIGVPPDRARTEVDAHNPVQWALGHDRSVLTHLNQFARSASWASSDGSSLPAINQRLAKYIILKPKVYVAADDVLQLLGGNPSLQVIGRRAVGQEWNETYALMQAQAGKPVVTMPVLRLVGSERLEAHHQASMLMNRLPIYETRTLASGRHPRWIPGELMLDLEGIEAIGPAFAATLLAEAQALGLQKISLCNALGDVAALLLKTDE